MDIFLNQTFFHGSKLLNLIVRKYLYKLFTICIVWNFRYDFQFSTVGNVGSGNISIPGQISSQIVSLTKVEDFEEFINNVRDAMEINSCEGFMVFDDDIIDFLDVFRNASVYSDRRFPRNHFILIAPKKSEMDESIFNHDVVKDHPDVLFIEQLDTANFNLWTTQFVGKYNNSKKIFLDSYNGINNSFITQKNLFPDKIKNQQGRPLKLATFTYKPYTIITKPETPKDGNARDMADTEDSRVHLDGTEGLIILLFCEKFNCSTELILDQEGEWGNLYDNMTGTGIFGNLIARNAEIGIGALYLWYHEYHSFQFSKPITRTGISCLVPVPRRIASWLLPVQPFAWDLWVAVIVVMILSSITFEKMLKNLLKWKILKGRRIFFQGTETILRTYLGQSADIRTHLMSIRTIFLSSFVLGLLISNAYSGGLSSILTVPSYEEPIDSIQKIAEKRLPWAATSPAWIYTIQGSPDPVIQKALSLFHLLTEDQMRVKSFTKKYGFTIERLPFGHFAVGSHITEEAAEFLQMMMTDIYYEYCVLFSFKTWSGMEDFDDLVLRVQQSGIQKYWEYSIIAKYSSIKIQVKVALSRLRENSNDPEALGLINSLGMMIIWAIGITISSIAFFFEICGFSAKRKRTLATEI